MKALQTRIPKGNIGMWHDMSFPSWRQTQQDIMKFELETQ